MMKITLVAVLVLSCLIAEILACSGSCEGDSSSSASSECGCRRRHHRHHKSRCCCSGSSEDTTTSAPATTTTTAFSCDKSSIDLVFVVDTSGSVGIENFNKTLEALVSIVQNITIGPNDDQSHIGLVTFSSSAVKIFGLADHMDTASVQAAIAQTPYTYGGTNIESGMNLAIDQVFDQAGDRANSPDIMIVITDGQDSSNVTGAQQTAASKGITVFAVGVGFGVDYNQLIEVAGDPARAYNATTFDFLDEILADICDNLGGSSNSNSAPSSTAHSSAARSLAQARSAVALQGACDYDAAKKQLTDLSVQEFCIARPYCNNNC
uniref:VWFA domain-containing protein n=1 Tax=Acrobeloides nanus TaxID=290746 RepID=A0A914E7K4_9BILA